MTRNYTTREVLRLSRSTAECDEGPITELRPGHVSVRYDAEEPTGVVWTTLSFPGAVALRFTPDPACAPWMMAAYSRVSEVQDSCWLADLQAAAGDGRSLLPSNLRHFLAYFDHVGCVEVLAGAVHLDA